MSRNLNSLVSRRAFLSVLTLAALPSLAACGHKSAAPDPGSREVTEFHAAVLDGDADVLERLIRAKPFLVNAKNANGETPLRVATQKGNQEVADLLRKHGAHE